MNEKDISEINAQCCPDNGYEGIFTEPNYIPINIKEPVIYKAQVISGHSGGSCWDDSNPEYFENKKDESWKCLDLVLEKLKPSITYLQYKKISSLIHTNEETEREYYGNDRDWLIQYIILSELEEFLNKL